MKHLQVDILCMNGPRAGALPSVTGLQTLSLSGHKEVTADGLTWLVDCTAMTSLDLLGEALFWRHGASKAPRPLWAGHITLEQLSSMP